MAKLLAAGEKGLRTHLQTQIGYDFFFSANLSRQKYTSYFSCCIYRKFQHLFLCFLSLLFLFFFYLEKFCENKIVCLCILHEFKYFFNRMFQRKVFFFVCRYDSLKLLIRIDRNCLLRPKQNFGDLPTYSRK